MFDFAKEMFFEETALGKKTTRDKSLIRLLKLPAIMASGISTIILPEKNNELCDRFEVLLQEEQAGSISIEINKENIAIAAKLLEYR